MIRRDFTIKWLQLVLGAVFIYSLLLVFTGSVAGSLFSWFGFGPRRDSAFRFNDSRRSLGV